jgi:DNA-binding NarL/FixJ family response regulator
MNKIRLVIADDHEVVRKGLMLVLRQEQDFEILGEAHDGRGQWTWRRGGNRT